MAFDYQKSLEILERTPSVYRTLLSGLSPDWTGCNEGNETWSASDIVGHLIHGEKTDWIHRIEIILNESENKAFTPYDRLAQFKESIGKSLEELLDEFEMLRIKNLEILKSKNLIPADFQKTGIHPEFGKVTLSQLLSTWTIHDLAHINQASRVMMKHYKEDVGPWKKYFSILKNE
jgi:hypothetical protein